MSAENEEDRQCPSHGFNNFAGAEGDCYLCPRQFLVLTRKSFKMLEQENEKKDLCVGQCSYYENNRAKRNTPLTLERFVTAIRSDRWKRQVEDYRRLTAEGTDPVRARAIKDGMPGLVVAGVCEGGHSKCNFRRMSGYLMVDIDDCEGDVCGLLRRLCAEPWVQAGWVSISGRGLKLAVRVDALT